MAQTPQKWTFEPWLKPTFDMQIFTWNFVDTYQDFSEKRRQKKFGMVKFIRNLKNAMEGKTFGLSFNKLVRF